MKEGRIEFDRCICHVDSAQKMSQANLGRILGPKGLMPSTKLGTITKDVVGLVKKSVGGTEYRERLGVVRCAVGQLGFTPEEMQKNIKALMGEVRRDIATLSDRIQKEIHEVVSTAWKILTFSYWHFDHACLLDLALDSWIRTCTLTSLQVLSSTNAPAFSLNGDFRSSTSLPTRDLAVL